MGTFTSINYHIVFTTKNRIDNISPSDENRIYSYLRKIALDKKCIIKVINGTSNHIHMILYLHPTKSLMSIIRDLKSFSSLFIRKEIDDKFIGWQEGYGAITIQEDYKHPLIKYIANQKEHHKKFSFEEEFIRILEKFDIPYDKKNVFDDLDKEDE